MRRLAAAFAVLALAACTGESGDPLPFKTVPIEPYMGQTVLGDANAPVEVVEYASTTCSHCRHFHKEELPKLKTSYIDTGKAKLRYVVLPTAPAEISLAGAAVARCAGKDKFFDVIGDLFEHQGELVDASSGRKFQKLISDLGGRHGLSFDQVNTCIEHQPIFTLFQTELKDLPDTVTGTPAFFVDGEKVEATAEAISAAIEKKLAAPAAPAAPQ